MDVFFLNFMNFIATNFGFIATPFYRLVSIVGEYGIIFLIMYREGESMGIIILLAVVVVLCLISIVYKQITGKEMDFSSSKEKKESSI